MLLVAASLNLFSNASKVVVSNNLDIDELKDEIRYKICIWDDCHESDLGVLYCTADNIEIYDNKLTINCKGEHVYGGLSDFSDSDGKLEFKMFVPFSK